MDTADRLVCRHCQSSFFAEHGYDHAHCSEECYLGTQGHPMDNDGQDEDLEYHCVFTTEKSDLSALDAYPLWRDNVSSMWRRMYKCVCGQDHTRLSPEEVRTLRTAGFEVHIAYDNDDCVNLRDYSDLDDNWSQDDDWSDSRLSDYDDDYGYDDYDAYDDGYGEYSRHPGLCDGGFRRGYDRSPEAYLAGDFDPADDARCDEQDYDGPEDWYSDDDTYTLWSDPRLEAEALEDMGFKRPVWVRENIGEEDFRLPVPRTVRQSHPRSTLPVNVGVFTIRHPTGTTAERGYTCILEHRFGGCIPSYWGQLNKFEGYWDTQNAVDRAHQLMAHLGLPQKKAA